MRFSCRVVSILLGVLLYQCATFSPPINGLYELNSEKIIGADKVNVLFVFKHYKQTVGIDAVPKLVRPQRNFNDIFQAALQEISNIDKFNTITIEANDVNNVDKRNYLARLKNESDYVIEMSFKEEKSFVKFFFGVVASSVSLTVIPIRYKYKYTIETIVKSFNQEPANIYVRNADLNKWVQTFMVFLYPFNHQKREVEEMYIKSMRNIFNEIEDKKVLNSTNLKHTTRTVYAINEVCEIIEKYIPQEVIHWKIDTPHSWIKRKDIAIIVHFPDDGINQKLAKQAFKMDVDVLDRKTNEKGILFWVDKEEKYPLMLISARNETILKSHLENNLQLKVMLNGMFHLKRY